METAAANPAAELIGIWQARRNFGPEVRGTLTLTREADDLIAEIGAYRVIAREEGIPVA